MFVFIQMILNNLNNSGDLRSRLGKPRTKTQYRDPIQVVVTNTNLKKSSLLKRNNSSELVWKQDRQVIKDIQPSEMEEGEWQESENENDQENENEKIERNQCKQYILTEDDEEKQEVEKEEGEEEEEEREEEEEEEEDEEEEEEKIENREDEENSTEEDSNMPAKEVQGPKGSVIKVVPPKPRVASTVWARLNHIKSEINDSYLKNR